MIRRIYCHGPGDRPCPAHAWWYSTGRQGRPRELCDVCHREKRRAAQREDDRESRRVFGSRLGRKCKTDGRRLAAGEG